MSRDFDSWLENIEKVHERDAKPEPSFTVEWYDSLEAEPEAEHEIGMPSEPAPFVTINGEGAKVTFTDNEGFEVGILHYDPQYGITFDGYADDSARVFFDCLQTWFDAANPKEDKITNQPSQEIDYNWVDDIPF